MAKHWFIVAPLDGPVSGGTVYNRELLRELARRGVSVEALAPGAARTALRAGHDGFYWVDSLFLEQLEPLARDNLARRPLGLVAHYLPSLVEHGDAVTATQLSRAEAFTLQHADLVLAPSQYMQATLRRLGLGADCRCLVVEPGGLAAGVTAVPDVGRGVRAVMVASLTPGKGVEPFLRALDAELADDDELSLTIVGRVDAELSYARACAAVLEAGPQLARRVTLAGEKSPAAVISVLSNSNLLISASRMESFGMAIAEARTLGVPVVARAAGNTRALVDPAAGGVLSSDDRALARACVAYARDHQAHARALELARRRPRPPRSFADMAADFVNQLSSIERAGAR